jgi:hypothetical protein
MYSASQEDNSTTACQGIWHARLLGDLKNIAAEAVELKVDNKNPVFHHRSKHIHTRFHFIQEASGSGEIRADFISTRGQLADILPKCFHEQDSRSCEKKWYVSRRSISLGARLIKIRLVLSVFQFAFHSFSSSLYVASLGRVSSDVSLVSLFRFKRVWRTRAHGLCVVLCASWGGRVVQVSCLDLRSCTCIFDLHKKGVKQKSGLRLATQKKLCVFMLCFSFIVSTAREC